MYLKDFYVLYLLLLLHISQTQQSKFHRRIPSSYKMWFIMMLNTMIWTKNLLETKKKLHKHNKLKRNNLMCKWLSTVKNKSGMQLKNQP